MNELKTISIDGVEYEFASFTDQQKLFVAQVSDLNQKISGLQMQTDQFSVARDAFLGMLKQSLTTKE